MKVSLLINMKMPTRGQVSQLDEEGVLYDLQHSVRHDRSCETQLVMLVEGLVQKANELAHDKTNKMASAQSDQSLCCALNG